MEQSFNLPSVSEIRKLTEEQLKPIFFQLEQHRSRQLLEASEDYTERVQRVNKDYTSCFQTLADILAEKRKKTV